MIKKSGIIFCFVLFLPYIVTVFVRGIDEAEKIPDLQGPVITIVTEKGTENIPMDEYLCGILSQYYGKEYTREELKVIGIILRTNLLYELENHRNFNNDIWDYRERRSRWGGNFFTYEKDLKNIINETSGQILLLNGKMEKITIAQLRHENITSDVILQNEYADYVIYHYF